MNVVFARLRRSVRRAAVYAQVVGGALLLALAYGAATRADGDRYPQVLAVIAAVIGALLLWSAARDNRRNR